MPDNTNSTTPLQGQGGATTLEPEHHQTQAATGSPQSGTSVNATAGGVSGVGSGTTSANATTGNRSALSESASREYGTGMPRRESPFPSLPSFPAFGALGGSPFSMMRNLADQMDRFFDDFVGLGGSRGLRQSQPSGLQGSGQGSSPSLSQGLWYPQVEVREREGKLVVCTDLPGMRKEDVHVEVRDNALILQGERRQESEQGGESFYRSERSYGHFQRVIPLPEGVDAGQAQASFKDGVLEITVPLPQRDSPQGRRIEIR
jgi:HSP20 family protein